MASPDDEHRLAEQRLEEVRKQTEEYVVPATEVDFIEVARRTDGGVLFGHFEPKAVQWWGTDGLDSLSWVIGDGFERRLNISVPTGNSTGVMRENQDITSFGIVMGYDYVALVERDPEDKELIKGFIATRGSIRSLEGPISHFDPKFREALDLGSNPGEQGSATPDSRATK